MKKLFALLLAFATALTLFACGKTEEPASSAPSSSGDSSSRSPDMHADYSEDDPGTNGENADTSTDTIILYKLDYGEGWVESRYHNDVCPLCNEKHEYRHIVLIKDGKEAGGTYCAKDAVVSVTGEYRDYGGEEPRVGVGLRISGYFCYMKQYFDDIQWIEQLVDWPDAKRMDISTLKLVPANADAKKLTADEVTAGGVAAGLMEKDLYAKFGRADNVFNTFDHVTRKTYVYKGMTLTFNKAYNDEYYSDDDPNKSSLWKAVFTDEKLTYPRGIHIGDDFYDVIAKFPHEGDYRKGNLYGAFSDRSSDPYAYLTFIHSDNDLRLLISCGHWPCMYVRFDKSLKVSSVEFRFMHDGEEGFY